MELTGCVRSLSNERVKARPADVPFVPNTCTLYYRRRPTTTLIMQRRNDVELQINTGAPPWRAQESSINCPLTFCLATSTGDEKGTVRRVEVIKEQTEPLRDATLSRQVKNTQQTNNSLSQLFAQAWSYIMLLSMSLNVIRSRSPSLRVVWLPLFLFDVELDPEAEVEHFPALSRL